MKSKSKQQQLLFACATALVSICASAQTNHFVWSGGTDASPYTNWATAAHEIQSAIIASAAGATVWVTNGTYNTGGVKHNSTSTTNRVAVTNAITVRSMNGPSNTFIVGRWHVPGDTNNIYGDAAVRCVYLVNGASLIGFTVSNGATRASTDRDGGGILAQAGAVASNCVAISNAAAFLGGGISGGIILNCSIVNNRAIQGGAGASGCVLLDTCTISGNSGANYGGGTAYCTVTNCDISGNTAVYGGGSHTGTNFNCRIIGNTATSRGGGLEICIAYDTIISNNVVLGSLGGSGTFRATLYRCRVVNNTGPAGISESTAHHSLIAGNTFSGSGTPGASISTLWDCVISNNVNLSGTGGAGGSALYRCTLVNNTGSSWGGGTRSCTLYNCIVKNNVANAGYGGGLRESTAYNTLITGNTAGVEGGGVLVGTLYNCTVVGNVVTGTTSYSRAGGISGQTAGLTNVNTIAWHNTVAQGSDSNHYGALFSRYSCAAPLIAGPGNTDADPMFKDYGAGNYYPAKRSPCLNSGAYYPWMTDPGDTRSKDLDGGPRIRHNLVDMGAFETRISRGSLFSAE